MIKALLFFVYCLSFGLTTAFALEPFEATNFEDMYKTTFARGDVQMLTLLNERLEQEKDISTNYPSLNNLYQKSLNYLQIDKSLSECEQTEGFRNERNLTNILKEATRSNLDGCLDRIPDQSLLKEFLEKNPRSSKYMDFSLLEEKIYWQAMQNSMDTYAFLSTLTNETDPKKWQIKLATELRQKYCQENTITPQLKKYNELQMPIFKKEDPRCVELMNEIIKKYSKRDKTPYDEILNTINTGIQNVNREIMDIDDTASVTEESDEYIAYASEYMKLASQGPGLLLHTEAIGNREEGGTGHLSTPKELFDYETRYHLQLEDQLPDNKEASIHEKYPMIGESIEEAQNKTFEGIEELKSSYRDKQQHDKYVTTGHAPTKIMESARLNDLKELVKFSPVAAGQVLMDNPETATLYCSAMVQLEKDDVNKKERREAIKWGGMIVGGALVVSGVGFGVGSAVIAGTVLSVGEAMYFGGVSYYEHKQYKKYERALFTGNSHNRDEMDKSIIEFKKSLINSGVALGGVVLFEAKTFKVLRGSSPNTVGMYANKLQNNLIKFKSELGEEGLKRLLFKKPSEKVGIMSRLMSSPTRMLTKHILYDEGVLTFVPKTLLTFYLYDNFMDWKKANIDEPSNEVMARNKMMQELYVDKIYNDFSYEQIKKNWQSGRINGRAAVAYAKQDNEEKHILHSAIASGNLSHDELLELPALNGLKGAIVKLIDQREETSKLIQEGKMRGFKMTGNFERSKSDIVSELVKNYQDTETNKELITAMVKNPAQLEFLPSEYKERALAIAEKPFYKKLLDYNLTDRQLLYEAHMYLNTDGLMKRLSILKLQRLNEDGSVKTRQDIWEFHQELIEEKYHEEMNEYISN